MRFKSQMALRAFFLQLKPAAKESAAAALGTASIEAPTEDDTIGRFARVHEGIIDVGLWRGPFD